MDLGDLCLSSMRSGLRFQFQQAFQLFKKLMKFPSRLLPQKLEEAGEELKKSKPEAFRRLRLEELIREGRK